MRVAVVTTSWPRFEGDPSGHFVEAEARALTQRGDEVVVIAADGDAFGWPGFAARVRERPARVASAAAWIARARAKVAQGRFDRIVAHWAVPSAWPIVTSVPLASAARSSRGPELEVVSHGGDVRLLVQAPRLVRARLVRRIARRATSWRFVSSSLLGTLESALPRDAVASLRAVARVAPCAIELVPPAPEAVLAKRRSVGEPYAVCVARLVPSKRVEEAIAWAAMKRAALVVVGDGPERASLERTARAHGGRVLFTGKVPRDEALAWIAASRELVQASREEGLSTVEREAHFLGVSVTRVPAPTR
jgi:glycosyltransferase involved in cell wall biosynthesis